MVRIVNGELVDDSAPAPASGPLSFSGLSTGVIPPPSASAAQECASSLLHWSGLRTWVPAGAGCPPTAGCACDPDRVEMLLPGTPCVGVWVWVCVCVWGVWVCGGVGVWVVLYISS